MKTVDRLPEESGTAVKLYRKELSETRPDITEPVMANMNLIYGTRTPRVNYRHVALEAIVGKTIQGVATTTVQGENGDEPCVMLLFTDGTKHGFVLPSEEEARRELEDDLPNPNQDEGGESTTRYRNHYRCVCGHEWTDEWDCMCNDRCPKCDTEIEPYHSEELA
jgi:hypothetical protein